MVILTVSVMLCVNTSYRYFYITRVLQDFKYLLRFPPVPQITVIVRLAIITSMWFEKKKPGKFHVIDYSFFYYLS